MKNIISILLTALILSLASSYSKSQSVTEVKSDTLKEWTTDEVYVMTQLIPLLYKDVLRLDSCIADAEVLDSMVVSLNNLISQYRISGSVQDEIIANLNYQISEYSLILERKDDQIVLVKKKSFWSGFKWGIGVETVAILIIFGVVLF